MMLGDFLHRHTDFTPAKLGKNLTVHGHCHHKTVLGMEAASALLKQAGVQVDILDSGCCGMAGSFGYETDKYPHSLTIAEDVLLPATRALGRDTILVSDGFSCRAQIADLSQVKAWTLPEILAQTGTN